nr:uncharacterized protein LOC127330372 [Lolium perenne]
MREEEGGGAAPASVGEEEEAGAQRGGGGRPGSGCDVAARPSREAAGSAGPGAAAGAAGAGAAGRGRRAHGVVGQRAAGSSSSSPPPRATAMAGRGGDGGLPDGRTRLYPAERRLYTAVTEARWTARCDGATAGYGGCGCSPDGGWPDGRRA